jgi:hypothetical protein
LKEIPYDKGKGIGGCFVCRFDALSDFQVPGFQPPQKFDFGHLVIIFPGTGGSLFSGMCLFKSGRLPEVGI